ncbi:ARABIDILLO 2-like [Paramuricea clavata]|uniref:ARABIDILLO 2-like n=1 Tax=Paramuricea clavata TaxID=317549 RepID=A0A7D9L8S6_PARCT|nr:ARABIDILLO 2-like [Paramuricea clavata]
MRTIQRKHLIVYLPSIFFICTKFNIDVLIFIVVFYLGHAAFLLASFILVLLLFRNFQYEVGDIIVDNLVQSRDLDKVLRSAKLGGIKERRNAAFEMVSLVASNTETKMALVNEGGLQVLINLALSTDSATQEYATEAISEMLTVPSIQAKFVEAGGIRTLCALLRSSDMRVVTEAVTAMSYIVADNEANRLSFITENGLNDLSHVSTKVSAPLSRIVAGMFLELAFSSEIRSIMSTQNAPVHALLSLSKADDHETLRLALQTLELLAIENPTVILANNNLLLQLLSVPKFEKDEQLYLLAGKIILYYASDENGCSKLVESGELKPTLLQFSHTTNVALQTVIAKIVLAVVDSYENKDTILEMSLDEVLLNIHDTTDNTASELTDQALTILKDIAPYSKKSEGSTIQSDDGSGPSTSQPSDKSGPVKRK